VIEDHDRIEELLAGYALLALSGEDAAAADRLLTDHVPSCFTCRQTLLDFQALSGDLALAAEPVPPPDLVLSRIQRSIEEVPLSGRPARRGSLLALAASVVALVAMGGLSFAMASRANQAEDRTSTALELLSAMRSPGVDPVRVDPQGDTPTSTGFLEVSAPDYRRLYLVAENCPDPDPGYAYQLWLGSNGSFEPFGEMFSPGDGLVLLELVVDVSRYDEIWITEEIVGSTPAAPSTDRRSWSAQLA
jgi:hypothetical protein